MISTLRSLLLMASCALAACGDSLRPLRQDAPVQPLPQVLVVKLLAGQLGTPELALCQRALRTADSHGLQAVVFDIGFAHGLSESQADVAALMDRVLEARTTTVAFVHGHVIEGAAYLALMCDRLYLDNRPDTDFGSVYHSEWKLEDLFAASPGDAERQRLESFREDLLARLDRRKQKLSQDARKLCAGMADPSIRLVRGVVRSGGVEQTRIYEAGELAGLASQGVEVLEQTEITRPVQLSAAEAVDAGVASGRVESLEHLLTDYLNVPPKDAAELGPNWSEHMVGWLELLRPALLVLGFVLLILEVKTPGVGLPGLLGSIFLLLALCYSYLVGLAEISEILLFFLGIAALAVEIFLLPGMIVFGATGFLCLVFALILSQQSFVLPTTESEQDILFHNLLQLSGLFAVVIAAAMSLWRFLPKVPLLNRLYLPAPEPGIPGGANPAAAIPSRTELVGRVAVAITTLRPAGAVDLDGERLDVVTQGEFLDAGARVRVIEVAGNRIVVEAVEDPERGSVGLVILLTVCGFLLLVAEIFLVSFGVLFLLSGASLFAGVFLAFQESVPFGIWLIVGDAIGAPLAVWGAFRLLPRTRVGKELMLEGPKPEEVRPAGNGLEGLLGKRGVAISPLRPAGFARIEGRKVDVVTRGEMLDEGSRVVVTEVKGNRVVVRQDGEAS
ncbi:MAG: hypothetical protein Fur0037_26370 [Planctomycetota bacterium]